MFTYLHQCILFSRSQHWGWWECWGWSWGRGSSWRRNQEEKEEEEEERRRRWRRSYGWLPASWVQPHGSVVDTCNLWWITNELYTYRHLFAVRWWLSWAQRAQTMQEPDQPTFHSYLPTVCWQQLSYWSSHAIHSEWWLLPRYIHVYTCDLWSLFSHHPQNDQVATQRFTSEEKRALERIQEDMYSDFRRAAEAHRYRALCTYWLKVIELRRWLNNPLAISGLLM